MREYVGSLLVGTHAGPNFIQEYTTAVIHEAIRIFPATSRLGKHVTTDTCVKAKIFDTHSLEVLREVAFPIKAGSDVILDIMGLHMNRRSFTTH